MPEAYPPKNKTVAPQGLPPVEAPDLLSQNNSILHKSRRTTKFFESSNHLGNVLSTFTDRRLGQTNSGNTSEYYEAEVVSATDYYPFGFEMPGRQITSDAYRFGFNGKEKDEDGEWGGLTHYDYGFRIYNPAIARFLSVDPLTGSYPMLTPYQFASNTPIQAIDLDGLERYWAADGSYLGKYGESTEMMIVTCDEMIGRAKNALANNKIENLDFFKKELPESSTTAYEATDKNELSLLRDWASKHRNTKREYAMSIFTQFIEKEDKSGCFRVCVEGTLAKGELKVAGENATVDPMDSKGPKGWRRSTTIHTHPSISDTYKDFSNIPPRQYSSGGDIQWSISNNIKLYMVPATGDFMGLFDPNSYEKYVLKRMGEDNEKYKEKLDRLWGGPYLLDNPGKRDFNRKTTNPSRAYWLSPDGTTQKNVIRNSLTIRISIKN